jgi:hypothetical protein
MNLIVIAAIINGKSSSHVQGVKLIIDDHTMIKIDENIVSPDGSNEGF